MVCQDFCHFVFGIYLCSIVQSERRGWLVLQISGYLHFSPEFLGGNIAPRSVSVDCGVLVKHAICFLQFAGGLFVLGWGEPAGVIIYL